MKKSKRSLALCGIIAAFCLGSCLNFTDDLDLNKEISLDMQIGPGGLSIPLGSLDTIFLDSLIKIDGDDGMLKKLPDGTYGISMEGSVDSVKVEIDPLTIEIDPPSIDAITTSFDTPKKENLKIKIPTEENSEVLSVGSIDMSGMEDNFTAIKLRVKTQEYPVGVANIPVSALEIPVPQQSQKISFGFTLPDDVEKLNSITFGEQNSAAGQKICLNVDLGGIYSTLSDPAISIKQMNVTFPDNFVLAEDPDLRQNYIKQGNLSVSGNVFSITMDGGQSIETLTGTSKILPLSFYLVSGDFSEEGHTIDYDGDISYSLTLQVSGTSKGTGNLYVDVSLDESLKVADFSVDTRAKQVDIPANSISSDYNVGGLNGMKRINYIVFDDQTSTIRLALSDFDIDPFQFAEGSNIRLVFSDDFVFDQTETYGGKATWDNTGAHVNTLLIDPYKTKNDSIVIHVKRLNIYEDVTGGSISMNNNVSYSSSITIASKKGLDRAGLESLHDQTITFKVAGDLFIDDADFTIEEIRTDLASSTVINVEKGGIDQSLVAVKRIDVDDNNPAGITMNLKFEGVPDEITQLTISDLTIKLPDFIKMSYTGNDANTYIDADGSIVINRTIGSYELDEDGPGLTISGFFIDGLQFKDPLVLEDGWIRLLNQKVEITGVAMVPESHLGLQGLDAITVTPSVTFNPITIKSAYGKVNPQIDPVHETVELSLGDGNDFLQNEKNTLSLSDPQITINLTSSITLPIDIDLSLSSFDSNGDSIGKNIGPDMGTIHLPKCDSLAENRTTTLVIYKNQRPVSQSQDTIFVRMSNLSELMKTIPDKIEFNLKASVDQSVYHFVDLTRKLCVFGDYSVSVPLAFDSLYMEYSDTIRDLGKDLEDVVDKIDAVQVQLIGDVESTIPLGVKLTAKAYDSNWNELTDIRIASFEVKAGSDTVTKAPMVLDVDVTKSGLEKLESIVFTAACESGEGGFSIHRGQWLMVKKLRIRFPEGLKVDLTDAVKDDNKD